MIGRPTRENLQKGNDEFRVAEHVARACAQSGVDDTKDQAKQKEYRPEHAPRWGSRRLDPHRSRTRSSNRESTDKTVPECDTTHEFWKPGRRAGGEDHRTEWMADVFDRTGWKRTDLRCGVRVAQVAEERGRLAKVPVRGIVVLHMVCVATTQGDGFINYPNFLVLAAIS